MLLRTQDPNAALYIELVVTVQATGNNSSGAHQVVTVYRQITLRNLIDASKGRKDGVVMLKLSGGTMAKPSPVGREDLQTKRACFPSFFGCCFGPDSPSELRIKVKETPPTSWVQCPPDLITCKQACFLLGVYWQMLVTHVFSHSDTFDPVMKTLPWMMDQPDLRTALLTLWHKLGEGKSGNDASGSSRVLRECVQRWWVLLTNCPLSEDTRMRKTLISEMSHRPSEILKRLEYMGPAPFKVLEGLIKPLQAVKENIPLHTVDSPFGAMAVPIGLPK
jgi:hypothetical protein